MEYIELVDDDEGQEGGEDDEDEDWTCKALAECTIVAFPQGW